MTYIAGFLGASLDKAGGFETVFLGADCFDELGGFAGCEFLFGGIYLYCAGLYLYGGFTVVDLDEGWEEEG
jgi:hypothetical protein